MADPVNTAASRSRARGQRRLRRRGRGESAGGVMAALSSLGIQNTIPQEPLRCNKSTTVDARVLDGGEGTGHLEGKTPRRAVAGVGPSEAVQSQSAFTPTPTR